MVQASALIRQQIEIIKNIVEKVDEHREQYKNFRRANQDKSWTFWL